MSVLLVPEDAARVWRRVPVEGVGYVDSAELLDYSDTALMDAVRTAELERYNGWRNHGNWWMDNLLQMTKRWGHTTGSGERGDLHDAQVLDYGCGLGLEGLQYARAGALVTYADISEANVELATRVLRIHEGEDRYGGSWVIDDYDPLPDYAGCFDIVHCVGVLHHIPHPQETMRLLHDLLQPDGELRVMLYTDLAWERTTGCDPNEGNDANRREFIEKMDHGDVPWSDWYDFNKLERLAGDDWNVARCVYLEPEAQYLAAILDPR